MTRRYIPPPDLEQRLAQLVRTTKAKHPTGKFSKKNRFRQKQPIKGGTPA